MALWQGAVLYRQVCVDHEQKFLMPLGIQKTSDGIGDEHVCEMQGGGSPWDGQQQCAEPAAQNLPLLPGQGEQLETRLASTHNIVCIVLHKNVLPLEGLCLIFAKVLCLRPLLNSSKTPSLESNEGLHVHRQHALCPAYSAQFSLSLDITL